MQKCNITVIGKSVRGHKSKVHQSGKWVVAQQKKGSIQGYRARKIRIIEEIEKREEPAEVITHLLEVTGLSIKTLATYVYEMTPKTLSGYRQKGKELPTRSLEISIKLQELYEKGIELFEPNANFNAWLQKECFGLGDRLPLKLLNTSSGIDLVYEELLRIEFGATA